MDIAGLVKGASRGEGLGNKFLSHIREVDAIVHVVRCFDDANITHVDGSVDPARDIETINLELVFADLETLERRMSTAQTKVKADKKYQEDIDRLTIMKNWLESGKALRNLDMDADFKQFVDEQFLLTSKPVIYVANTDEAGINGNAYTAQVEKSPRTKTPRLSCFVPSSKKICPSSPMKIAPCSWKITVLKRAVSIALSKRPTNFWDL